MASSEALLVGCRRDRAIGLVGGFAVAITVAVLAGLVADLADLQTAAAVLDGALPLIVFYVPAPLAALGAYLRCGGPACLALGVVPAVVLVAVALVGSAIGISGVVNGGTVLLETSVSLALVGLTGAFVGFCAGVTATLVADVVGVGSGA